MKKCTLLVVDRNPYIRSFLQREMSAAGYAVGLAANGFQTIEWVRSHRALDLLILDPDLPDTYGVDLLQKIYAIVPALPVVVHTLSSEYEKYSNIPEITSCIEKSGSSIEQLKAAVSKIILLSAD